MSNTWISSLDQNKWQSNSQPMIPFTGLSKGKSRRAFPKCQFFPQKWSMLKKSDLETLFLCGWESWPFLKEGTIQSSHMIFFKMTRTHSEWSILLGWSSQIPKPIFVLCQAWLRVQSVLRKYKITKRMRGKLNPYNHGSKMDHWESIPPMTLHTSLYSVCVHQFDCLAISENCKFQAPFYTKKVAPEKVVSLRKTGLEALYSAAWFAHNSSALGRMDPVLDSRVYSTHGQGSKQSVAPQPQQCHKCTNYKSRSPGHTHPLLLPMDQDVQ